VQIMRSGETEIMRKLCDVMQYYAMLCEKYAIFWVYGRDWGKKSGNDHNKKFQFLMVNRPHTDRIKPATAMIVVMRIKILFSRKNKNVFLHLSYRSGKHWI